MAMELRLQKLVEAMEIASDIDALADGASILMRRTSPAINKTIAFVCSSVEPNNMVLPLNVVWLNYDKNSPFYRQALKRKSKDADPVTGFNNTWEVLYYYEDALEAQYYDEEDQDAIGQAQKVPVASVDEFGIVKLYENPPQGEDPIVILDDDPRLSDPRTPKEHTHAEVPASILSHSTGTIVINDGEPQVGMALVAKSATAAGWRKLTSADIDPAPTK